MAMTIDPAVPRKLGLRPGMHVLLLDPPDGYADGLAVAEPGLRLEVAGDAGGEGRAAMPVDAVQVFCSRRTDLERVAPIAIAALPHDGLLWVAYLKGGSGVATDLKRDLIPPVLAPLGLRPVTQIAIDATWSALRFRPDDAVGHRA